MKKLRVPKIVLFILGLIFLSLGSVLAVKAKLGVSVATSIPYILNLIFTNISFGTWNYIIQGIVLILAILLSKKLELNYLISFVFSFIFGVFIDLIGYLLKAYDPNNIYLKIITFAMACVVIGLGLALLMKSKYPVLPFETFVQEFSNKYNISISKGKTLFDVSCLLIAVSISLTYFKSLKGINIGTLISALVVGNIMGFFIKKLDKYIY